MSHSSESSTLPTNEQIIDEITENLATKTTIENNHEIINNSKEDNIIPSDFEATDLEEPPEPVFDDFIDEEQLKTLESKLSDEEKLLKKKEALNLKTQGNDMFKQEKYEESIVIYTNALQICPLQFSSDRSVLYANRAASKAKLDRKQTAIDDCTMAIKLDDSYVKALLRRAKLYEDTEKLDESLADYNKIAELDPGNREAKAAQCRLPTMIDERNEKLKTEMLGKLKDIGNVILRPFGLSTENFQLTQDPNTGGYSVNFTQNKS